METSWPKKKKKKKVFSLCVWKQILLQVSLVPPECWTGNTIDYEMTDEPAGADDQVVGTGGIAGSGSSSRGLSCAVLSGASLSRSSRAVSCRL